MTIQLSDHFTYKKLLRYTFPSMVMLVFSSIYGVVDGLFVSNFVGKTAFAAVNFILPPLMMLGCFGFMFGTGGSALIAKTMGEGDTDKANRTFSLLIYVSIVCGLVLTVLGYATLRPVAYCLGARGQLLEDSIIYGRVYLLGVPACFLQYAFQCLFATSGRPHLGLCMTVAAGLMNILMDALLVAVLPWGLTGAALATVISQCVGGFVPLIYFARKNKSLLRLTRTSWDGRALFQTCLNGSSELLNNISMSVVGILYNFQLLEYAGEDGVAAFGVLMYLNFIFISLFLGFTMGMAPVVSYHFGAGNQQELRSLLHKSLTVVGVLAVVMFAAAEGLSRPLSALFVGYDPGLFEMTRRGFTVFSFSFLFVGVPILGSAFFTALSNGPVSALISFLRTLLFQVIAVLVLPLIWELDGIWVATIAAEAMAALVTVCFLCKNASKYGYGRQPKTL